VSNPFDLAGRAAIVTGAGRGLGAAMAEALAAAGAAVILSGRDLARLELVAGKIRKEGGRAEVALCDITRRSEVEELIAGVELRHQRVDILVNNAGINARAAVADVQDSDWDLMLRTHMTGPFIACRAALPGMMSRESGKIINTVSVLGELGRPQVVPYAAAKGGLRMLTRALAAEVARANIQVNGIGPGYFETEMNTAIVQDRVLYAERVARIPAGRWGRPEELGGTAVYLASSASNYVTGQIIYVDGGLTASF